jgi:mono/diheme cytochrome c family protein
MKTTYVIIVTLAASIVAVTAARSQDAKLPPASTKENITYVTDIKPLFDANCAKCHSGDKPKAHLKLDSLAGILKGNKWGPGVKAGDAANSIVVKAIAHQTKDHDGWMPPIPNKAGAKTLTPEQIGLVIAWINQGAK